MGIEIERKFLVVGEGWRAAATRVERLVQGYLNPASAVQSGAQRCSVRVRVAGDRAWLNIKSAERGASRQEFEYPLPPADAAALLGLCVDGVVEKHRHHVEHAGHHWEVDEFLGANTGLVVAEIELAAVDEAFQRPDWLGREVTDESRYYNLALSARPYSAWSAGEKS